MNREDCIKGQYYYMFWPKKYFPWFNAKEHPEPGTLIKIKCVNIHDDRSPSFEETVSREHYYLCSSDEETDIRYKKRLPKDSILRTYEMFLDEDIKPLSDIELLLYLSEQEAKKQDL